MTTPSPRKDPRWSWARLWRVTDHEVIGGLVVAATLAVIGVLFATGHNGGDSPSAGHDTGQQATPPGHSATQPVSSSERPTIPTTSVATSPAPVPSCPKQVVASAGPALAVNGPPPWTVEDYGIRFTVVAVTRTTSEWAFETKPSLTITSCITRTQPADPHSMEVRFSDAASSSVLDAVPTAGSGDANPPLNQTSRLVAVRWDLTPPATHLTITLHDFFWPDTRNLTLTDVPVSSHN